MRIVVQDPRTGYYLEEMGGWTSDVKQARDFPSSADAMIARRQYQVADASLVFRFEREGYAISVPLEPLVVDGSSIPLQPKPAATPQELFTG